MFRVLSDKSYYYKNNLLSNSGIDGEVKNDQIQK